MLIVIGTSSSEPALPRLMLKLENLGCSKAITRHLCARIGVALYTLDPSRLPSLPVERQACYRLLERESMLLPCAYYVDCPDAGQATPAEAGHTPGHPPDDALDVARGMRALLFAASHEPLSDERSFITVRVPRSDAQTQFAVWKEAFLGN